MPAAAADPAPLTTLIAITDRMASDAGDELLVQNADDPLRDVYGRVDPARAHRFAAAMLRRALRIEIDPAQLPMVEPRRVRLMRRIGLQAAAPKFTNLTVIPLTRPMIDRAARELTVQDSISNLCDCYGNVSRRRAEGFARAALERALTLDGADLVSD